ncbi:MAG: SPFH domain-containing protein [Armatimonadetes bacterium]|nr:SPFH domain-containing protein [Armatimonadota bacterium]
MSNGNYQDPFGGPVVRYRAPQTLAMANPIQAIIFLFFAGIGVGIGLSTAWSMSGMIAAGALGMIGIFGSMTVKIAAEWEKGLVFRLGRFMVQRGPGMFFVVPFFDTVKLIDTRIQTLPIPHKQAITKDNVPVRIDGVIFMRVETPENAIVRVQNYEQAVQEYAQTALRDIVGSMTLDDLLTEREALGRRVEEMVSTEIDGWGLHVQGIRIQDIELPEDLKRVMARQASAEREKRATITKAEGDREAADNLAAAAHTMAASPGALQLRTLQTLDGLGPSSSNTVVLALPIEVFEAMRSIPQFANAVTVKRDAQSPTND